MTDIPVQVPVHVEPSDPPYDQGDADVPRFGFSIETIDTDNPSIRLTFGIGYGTILAPMMTQACVLDPASALALYHGLGGALREIAPEDAPEA